MPTLSIAMNIGALFAIATPQPSQDPSAVPAGFEALLAGLQNAETASPCENLLLSTNEASSPTQATLPFSDQGTSLETLLASLDNRINEDPSPPPGVVTNLVALTQAPPGIVQNELRGEELPTQEPNAQSKPTDLPAIKLELSGIPAKPISNAQVQGFVEGTKQVDPTELAFQELISSPDVGVKMVRVDKELGLGAAPVDPVTEVAPSSAKTVPVAEVPQPEASQVKEADPAPTKTVAPEKRTIERDSPDKKVEAAEQPSVAPKASDSVKELKSAASASSKPELKSEVEAIQDEPELAQGSAPTPHVKEIRSPQPQPTELRAQVAASSQGEAPTSQGGRQERREAALRIVADRIEMASVLRSRESVTIHMDPLDLGEIKLVLNHSEGKMDAQVYAQDSRVRDMLATGHTDLSRTLENRGIRLDGFRVDTFSPSTTDSGQGHRPPSEHSAPRMPKFGTERTTTHSAPVRIKTTGLDLAI